MKRVLVTAIGTITATTAVRELKKTGDCYLIGADINRQLQIATSLDVDEYHQFPLATNDAYLPFILDFCREHRVEYYYAVIDKEVTRIAQNKEQFEAIGTKLCVPDSGFVEICHYKDRFNAWIAEQMPEIAIRTYEQEEAVSQASFSLFIKPVEGVASAGCRRVDTMEELKAAIHSLEPDDAVIIQEYTKGEIVTADCIRNRKTGQKIQVQRRELLRNANGCGIAVEIIEDQDLSRICDTLMERLDLNGVCNMEFFKTTKGYRIIEINPRLSAGAVFSCMAGVNPVLEAMRIADGEPCAFGEIAVGAQFAERYEAYRMK